MVQSIKPVGFIATLIIIAALITGCVNVKTVPYETEPRAPKPKDFPIEILDAHGINRPYKVIGLVQANAGKKHSVEDTLEKLRDAARQMGADALLSLDNKPLGAAIPSQGGVIYSGHARDLWKAKAIVWE
jgi:hypothetical protein